MAFLACSATSDGMWRHLPALAVSVLQFTFVFGLQSEFRFVPRFGFRLTLRFALQLELQSTFQLLLDFDLQSNFQRAALQLHPILCKLASTVHFLEDWLFGWYPNWIEYWMDLFHFHGCSIRPSTQSNCCLHLARRLSMSSSSPFGAYLLHLICFNCSSFSPALILTWSSFLVQ